MSQSKLVVVKLFRTLNTGLIPTYSCNLQLKLTANPLKAVKSAAEMWRQSKTIGVCAFLSPALLTRVRMWLVEAKTTERSGRIVKYHNSPTFKESFTLPMFDVFLFCLSGFWIEAKNKESKK